VLSAAYYLVEYFEQPALLIDQQLGVADYVDEEHIRDLELDFFLNLRGHGGEFYSVASARSTSIFQR